MMVCWAGASLWNTGQQPGECHGHSSQLLNWNAVGGRVREEYNVFTFC